MVHLQEAKTDDERAISHQSVLDCLINVVVSEYNDNSEFYSNYEYDYHYEYDGSDIGEYDYDEGEEEANEEVNEEDVNEDEYNEDQHLLKQLFL